MQRDYSKELIELAHVGEPFAQPTAKAWTNAERNTGLKFPSDFKKLISSIGHGQFGVALVLRNPAFNDIDFYRRCSLSKPVLKEFKEVLAYPEKQAKVTFYPDPEGLVSIGKMERQLFFWKPDRSGRLANGIVWLDVNLDRVMDIDMSITQFIHHLYLGLIQEEWAEELRNYIWFGCPFFTPAELPKVACEE